MTDELKALIWEMREYSTEGALGTHSVRERIGRWAERLEAALATSGTPTVRFRNAQTGEMFTSFADGERKYIPTGSYELEVVDPVQVAEPPRKGTQLPSEADFINAVSTLQQQSADNELLSLRAEVRNTSRQYERVANLLDCYGIPRFPLTAIKARLQRMYRAWNVPGADESLIPYTVDEWASSLPVAEPPRVPHVCAFNCACQVAKPPRKEK